MAYLLTFAVKKRDDMLLVGECIVSDDIAKARFCCDLSRCKGCCCVEGDAGAPLLKEEIEILRKRLPEIKPYMEENCPESSKKHNISYPFAYNSNL